MNKFNPFSSTNVTLVDYDVSTTVMTHYGLNNDDRFAALNPAKVLEMLKEDFKDCNFNFNVKSNGRNYAELDFGEGIQCIKLPES